MLDNTQAQRVVGSTAYDDGGSKIGSVGQLFLDDQTGRPEFVTVNTGMFGTSESFVPVAEATWDGERLTVPFSKDQVKDAPRVDADGGHLDQAEERRLYDHYGMPYSEAASDSGLPSGTGETAGAGFTDAGTDDAMTRSEERLDVGTESREAGRARLRKYVVTEHEQVEVPVTKERAVVEREPVTEANAGDALDGPAISEDEHEVVLHEERPVVEKTTEPVERVRLGKETDVEEQQVSEEVRKEQIEVEGDADQK